MAVPKNHIVPIEILVDNAKEYLSDVSYGSDSFKTYDIECIRAMLPVEYHGIPVDDIRIQITNARKKSLLPKVTENGSGQPKIDDILNKRPSWYQKYLKTEYWIKFSGRIKRLWGSRCALCYSKPNGSKLSILDVHHRRYRNESGEWILYRESETDVICLCRSCHKRHHKWQPEFTPLDVEELTLFK